MMKERKKAVGRKMEFSVGIYQALFFFSPDVLVFFFRVFLRSIPYTLPGRLLGLELEFVDLGIG